MIQQNKPHYTCPIIAAYMQKYFGVRFNDSETEISEIDNIYVNSPFHLVLEERKILAKMLLDDTKRKFYIAPESLEIFKPKNSDISNRYYYNKKSDTWIGDSGGFSGEILRTNFREGKPFFWYEV